MRYNMTEEEIDNEIKKSEQQFTDLMKIDVNCYESFEKKDNLIANLKKRVDFLICQLEVEHFLENGPKGQDPI